MGTPFTTSGTAQGAVLIQEMYYDGVVKAIYLNNDFLRLFTKKTWPGGNNYNWIVRRGSNASVEIFTEGQAQPAPDSQDYSRAYVAWTYGRGMIQVTGHALDAMRSNYVGIDVVDSEVEGCSEDIEDLLNTSFMGSTYGITKAIDSTATFAGIARGASPWWESTVTSVGRKLAFQDLIDLQETIRDNDKGGKPGAIFCPLNQETNIYQLTGQPAVKQIGPSDAAPALTSQSFNGWPIIALGDFDDNTILMVDVRPKQWLVPVIRPMSVKAMAPSGDSDIYQISTGSALICHNPKNHGKLSSVTA